MSGVLNIKWVFYANGHGRRAEKKFCHTKTVQKDKAYEQGATKVQ